MKITQVLLVGGVVSSALAIENVVKLSAVKTRTKGGYSAIEKREAIPESAAYDWVGFHVDLEVGTPPQTIRTRIDSGSSDFWFPTTHNANCPQGAATPVGFKGVGGTVYDYDYCIRSCQIDIDSSSTWKANYSADPFHIVYGDDSFARGVWGTDTVRWGSATIENYFLAASDNSSVTSLLGIGFPRAESTDDGERRRAGDAFQYPNWPQRLKLDGYTAKNVYTLFPDEDPRTWQYEEINATLLFGGVDNAKYSGPLVTFPINSQHDISIEMTGVTTHIRGVSKNATSAGFSISALFDSGTPAIWFPRDATKQVALNLGSSGHKNRDGYYTVPCEFGADDYLTIYFNEFGIDVLATDVISIDSPGVCALKIVPSDDTIVTLGDLFLLSAYVVYDLEDHELSIAQARYTDEEDIQPVISTVPGATPYSQYAAAAATNSS